MKKHSTLRLGVAALALGGITLLAGCAAPAESPDAAPSSTAGGEAQPRVALTYDGGLLVLDAESLDLVGDIEKSGFLRVNAAGDGDNVMVTTEEGFQVLHTGASDSTEPELTDLVFEGSKAGHVVPHGETTALYADGTGTTTVYETAALLESTTELPEFETITADAAHHGVSIVLEDGTLLTTIGDEDGRTGVQVLDESREEIARNEECPGVHGEGTAPGEVAIFGCDDGVLLYKDGAFTKLQADVDYGRTGNIFTSDASSVALGDYKTDPDAEGSLLSAVKLIDTEAETTQVVELPEGVEYTFRDLARTSAGDAVVLATDGSLHLIDVESGEITSSYPVIGEWEGPAEWQEAHPALKVLDDVAYVTEPATDSLHAIDLTDGSEVGHAELPGTPNEIAVVTG